MKVYLAGPEVFLPDAREVGERKKAACSELGLVGLVPSDNEIQDLRQPGADALIFASNLQMIQEADIGVFNLTPFRGLSADVGTVFELGIMWALGKPLFGYTNTALPLRSRVHGATEAADGSWLDPDGCSIENFDNADNLMIEMCLAQGSNDFVRHDAEGRLDDLAAFQTCLKVAVRRVPLA